MIVFMPPLIPMPEEVVVDGQVVIPAFEQGYILTNNDLQVHFYNAGGQSMTPLKVSYAVGFLSGGAPDQVYHTIGSITRIPIEMRTGLFRPNLMIGDTWVTGGPYQILWSYQVSEDSEVLTKGVEFSVVTAGIYDSLPITTEYHDIAATVVIV